MFRNLKANILGEASRKVFVKKRTFRILKKIGGRGENQLNTYPKRRFSLIDIHDFGSGGQGYRHNISRATPPSHMRLAPLGVGGGGQPSHIRLVSLAEECILILDHPKRVPCFWQTKFARFAGGKSYTPEILSPSGKHYESPGSKTFKRAKRVKTVFPEKMLE